MRKYSIKDWAEDDQPRKKLLNSGADSLSNSELLAILINNGTPDQSALDIARNLLQSVNNNLHTLSVMSVKDMVKQKIKGLGEAKSISIIAALELGIRRSAMGSRRDRITRSSDIADYLRASLEFRKKEIFVVVFLNRNNRILHIEPISEGGFTGTVADPRVILKKSLEHNATALILCHNHPGGSLRPSTADELITQKIKHAALLLDIHIMDHIIVSDEGYFSFADEGML
jgi:DNA repair protein RadC